MPGAKVVAMVCAHMRGVFMEHRKALKNKVDYCRRSTETRGRCPWECDGMTGVGVRLVCVPMIAVILVMCVLPRYDSNIVQKQQLTVAWFE